MFLIDCFGIQCNVRFSITCAMVFQALQAYHLCQVVPVSFSFNSLWLLFFSDYGKYEQSIETSTDPKDHDGV